jgi:tetratricopeptide (TPR) repeat protein
LLGRIARELEEYRQAEILIRQAECACHYADLPQFATVRDALGVVFMDMEKLEEAKDCFSEAFEIRHSKFGENHVTTVESRLHLAEVKMRQGEDDAARKLMEQAELCLHQARPDGKHPLTREIQQIRATLSSS